MVKTTKQLRKYFNDIKLSTLIELKNKADNAYYNTDETIMDDIQYDILMKVILEKDPDYIPPVGTKIREEENRVKLPYWLGSIDKIKPEDVKELNKLSKTDNYIIEDKLDGVSCLLIIKDKEIFLYTRGNGKIGADISYLSKYFKTIPKNIKVNIAIRGELLMKKSIFEEKYSSICANARNMVSGRLGGKTIREGIEDIEFIAYEIIDTKLSPSQQLYELSEIGFQTVNHIVNEGISIEKLTELLLTFKAKSEYEIDGIIFQNNYPYKRNTSGNPKYAFAFKMTFEDNIKEAIVEDVEWNISKWGIIKPRIRIKPISLNGVTITYATGFNGRYILDNQIGKGAIVKITRSGDVIPFIIETITPSKNVKLPEDISFLWNENKIDIYTEEDTDIMKIKLITSFFSKLNIKFVSEATITKMYKYGLDSIIKIVEASQEDFSCIEGFGKRLAERSYDNIHNGLQEVFLADVLGASGVFKYGMGIKKITALIKNIPDILVIYKSMTRKKLIDRILEVDGFSEKSVEKIVDNLEEADNFIKKLSRYATFKNMEIITNIELKDKKYVMSGFRDKEMEEKIKKLGGDTMSSVSKETEGLIVVDKNKHSAKIEKAKLLNIPIFSIEEFNDFLSSLN